ncbi:hypothetical protein FVEG_04850 [Fusarium verticillioides 7600]|uniref:Uncharacterized protein n=1 Tax=Gibberella moniliformis (strain M3125 / FGSC 7600) TaxID=334819 RepID=W7M750_GIBM7|nr:hypothetical protein FVEG_04850 [Fusarium verticillioides 7600]EWG43319.1 hypothetical protein FVEG_04850 [Fusarium verticillioides 7600]RBQ83396.1 hypothetical protein FVER53263_04850 [Fusarium verticillioides]
MDHIESDLESVLIKLEGPQSITTAEFDLIAQHPEWFTTLGERERLALSESRALQLLEEIPSDYEVYPGQYAQIDHYLTRHGQLQRMIDASKMMQRLWARQKADDEEAGLITPTIEDRPHTWTEDLATFARGCLKALSGEIVDFDDDMDGSHSGTEHEEGTCVSPDLPEIITLSPEFARHMRDQIRNLPCRAVEWKCILKILGAPAPVKDEVLLAIRTIMCGLVEELIQARSMLENRRRGLSSKNQATVMLQAPTHLARMVGVLDIEKDGKLDSYAEWKSLEKGFPARYKGFWSDIDCLWPLLADIRAWSVISRNLHNIYQSEVCRNQVELLLKFSVDLRTTLFDRHSKGLPHSESS